jgi:predicted metalloprotease with PDZ domain
MTRYQLSFPSLHAHLVDVVAHFPAGGRIRMAAWTPGSYLVREYARHVQDLVADGETPVRKVAKDTWQVDAAGPVTLRYRVYGWDLSVRTNHIDATHAFLNGAPTFLYREGSEGDAISLSIEAPAGWHVVTPLARDEAGGFRARNLDELIDSPLHLGPAEPLRFEAGGKPHELAVWGRPDAGVATLADLVADTQKIVAEHDRLFGGLPYERYAMQLMLASGAYGGLEHRGGAALLSSPFAFATRKKYEELLELISHEHFHAWNGKRIRPSVLGPFDYRQEAYTRSLWVVEGFTSYYDRYGLRRAKLMPAARYLERLAEDWASLQAIPGREKQSIEESSFDAWIKLYRPDENSVNSTVSYYLKGGLVALALDLEIRRRTAEARSLDDVLRRLWSRWESGYQDDEVQAVCEAATDVGLGTFFDRFVRGREDPELATELSALGLLLRPKRGDGEARGWLGLNTRTGDGGRVIVTSVPSGSPAAAAGIYAGDELVALDGWRADGKGADERTAARKPGTAVEVTLFRRDALVTVALTLGDRPPEGWEIVSDEGATPEVKARRAAWLGEA